MIVCLPEALFEEETQSEGETAESGSEASEAEVEWQALLKGDADADTADTCKDDSGLHVTSYGGWVYQQGKRIGRIFKQDGGVVVNCYFHKPCCRKWVQLDDNLTRDGVMSWLRSAHAFSDSPTHLEALQIGCAFVPPVPPVPVPMVPAVPPPPARHPAPRGGRNVNKVDFGIWSVSIIRTDGVESRWGANCGKHRNCWESSSARCKRSIGFGPSTMPEEEARRRMKKWLLMGHGISGDLPDGKEQHFNVDPHSWTLEELEPEDELDTMALLIRDMA